MADKFIKARKPHECSRCGFGIDAGDKYFYYEERLPVYADVAGSWDSTQIGIEYHKSRYCMGCYKEMTTDGCGGF